MGVGYIENQSEAVMPSFVKVFKMYSYFFQQLCFELLPAWAVCCWPQRQIHDEGMGVQC